MLAPRSLFDSDLSRKAGDEVTVRRVYDRPADHDGEEHEVLYELANSDAGDHWDPGEWPHHGGIENSGTSDG